MQSSNSTRLYTAQKNIMIEAYASNGYTEYSKKNILRYLFLYKKYNLS